MDMEAIKNTALSAVFKGGRILSDMYGSSFRVDRKGRIDLVTEADTASETAIIETLTRRFPDHDVLAEESGASHRESPYRWVIDPLDGTTNFAHGLPLFSVSIAFQAHGETVFGVVFNPITEELFMATKGEGATLCGRPISVSEAATVEESLLVTGFPYNVRDIMPRLLSRFESCLDAAQGVRRLGSAALDLCFLACGRFDGFWEENLKAWDTAAGVLIAEEAGARITDFNGKKYTPGEVEMLATNGGIHQEMITLLMT
ncbi:inositol monophosphatase family protein [Desulfoluna sp.]|uniref:inositol monophosphatase family protein n=1 Tax=Desulfoluna sp. TaxID=2045199 RepID=UPI00260D1FAB|nr:inositol monophosphatase family protein [Desulfoluna sp.]